MTRQARSSAVIMGLDTHMILETVPVLPANARTCIRSSTGHHATMPGPWMNGAFPDALVTGYEPLIGEMANDPKDRHVLAAAVRGGAEVLVTENLRDFPPAAVRSYGIQVVSQDAYL